MFKLFHTLRAFSKRLQFIRLYLPSTVVLHSWNGLMSNKLIKIVIKTLQNRKKSLWKTSFTAYINNNDYKFRFSRFFNFQFLIHKFEKMLWNIAFWWLFIRLLSIKYSVIFCKINHYNFFRLKLFHLGIANTVTKCKRIWNSTNGIHSKNLHLYIA